MKKLTKENKKQIVEMAYRRVIERNISPVSAVCKAIEFYRPDVVEYYTIEGEEEKEKDYLISGNILRELIKKVEDGLKARERTIGKYGENACKYI